MTNNRFALFFWQVSRIVLTPLLLLSIFMLYDVLNLTAEEALRTYHSYPYMSEHILVGIVVYLAFSLTAVKIHRGSLHD